MVKNTSLYLFLCLSLYLASYLFPLTVYGQESAIKLDKAPIDRSDLASLQRGAKLYMNYCLGCHSLKYVRYNNMAKDIGIVDSQGKVLEKALKDSFVFSGGSINDPILSAMPKKVAAEWFGIAPPDLSLVARSRGVDWIYSYLRSFYLDNKRPWGVNNKVFPDVAMPDVLYNLQKQLSKEEYDTAVADIVNFLSYVGEPHLEKRKALGIWVLVFLGILFVFAILLKREYWKDIKNK